MPSPADELAPSVTEMVQSLLQAYDSRVTDRGMFADLSARQTVHFGDPQTTRPGRLELLVLAMDPEMNPQFDQMRCLSVRVCKSRDGGFASLSCLHGTRADLRAALERIAADPAFLLDRIHELADGLPEETNPDVWR